MIWQDAMDMLKCGEFQLYITKTKEEELFVVVVVLVLNHEGG